MRFDTMEAMLADAKESGVRFYMEVAPDGMFMRTVDTNKLVIRVGDDAMMFYDPDEIDIYQINETNEHLDHNSTVINMLMDHAWGEAGFGEAVEREFGSAMAAIAQQEFLNDSDGDLDND